MKNAYSLIRFSTDRQEWGNSRMRQVERANKECKSRGWHFDENLCLTDLGVSAFRGNNFQRKYALGKFLEAAQKGMLLPEPVLLVENCDRFSRDTLDNADSEFWRLVKNGVDVLILSNGLYLTRGDQNKVEKRAILMFEFDRANKESQRKSETVSSALLHKYTEAKNGKTVSLGNWTPNWVTFHGEKKSEGVFKFNMRAEKVKEIVTRYMKGESMFNIAADFNHRKEPCLGNGVKWTQGQIRHILTSEALIGQISVKGVDGGVKTYENRRYELLHEYPEQTGSTKCLPVCRLIA